MCVCLCNRMGTHNQTIFQFSTSILTSPFTIASKNAALNLSAYRIEKRRHPFSSERHKTDQRSGGRCSRTVKLSCDSCSCLCIAALASRHESALHRCASFVAKPCPRKLRSRLGRGSLDTEKRPRPLSSERHKTIWRILL